jgi:hypothetical protein
VLSSEVRAYIERKLKGYAPATDVAVGDLFIRLQKIEGKIVDTRSLLAHVETDLPEFAKNTKKLEAMKKFSYKNSDALLFKEIKYYRRPMILACVPQESELPKAPK